VSGAIVKMPNIITTARITDVNFLTLVLIIDLLIRYNYNSKNNYLDKIIIYSYFVIVNIFSPYSADIFMIYEKNGII